MTTRVLSVEELTHIIKGKFDTHLNKYFTIEGEVQDLSDKHHAYFSLKDKKSKTIIRCILWNGTKERNGYSLEEGDVIAISGKLGLYEKNNSYSFSVMKMLKEKTKETEYKRKYDMFKEKGYFKKHRKIVKEEIRNIGLITSMKGQALKDFMKTLKGRFFCGNVYIYNVNVQGIRCVKDNIKAIKYFENSKHNIDIILLTRGGGGKLELDSYNDEELVETIYECKKIVAVSIGHEGDFCLAEHTADLRSSTPTSLALEVSRDKSFLVNTLDKFLNKNKEIYHSAKTKLTMKINDEKNKLYKEIVSNKPNGFYIGKRFINTIADFKKLSKQKFVINLEDAVIEFDIKDYKVIKSKDTTYGYSNYMDLFNECDSVNHKNLSSLINNLSTYKFGTKKHFNTLEIILETIEYYNSNIIALDTINESEKNFELTIDLSKDLEQTFNNIKQYITHLNYLTELKEKNFKGIKCNKLDIINEDLYKMYSTYKSDTLTEELINLYLNIKKIKPKFLQIKRS